MSEPTYGIDRRNLTRAQRRARFANFMRGAQELAFLIAAVLIFWAATWWLFPNGATQ